MTEEGLGLLLIILAVLIMLGIELKRKIVKRPHFYWVIACAILAVLSTLLVRSQSIYLIVSGALLNLIFFSLFVGILIAGTARDKRPLYDDKTSKNNRTLSRYKMINRFRRLSQKYPGAIHILFALSVGSGVGYFASLLADMILSAMFDPSRHLIPPEPNVTTWAFFGDLTGPAFVGLHVVFAIVTFTVTFVFGLAFAKESIPIGLSTGLWVGLFVICEWLMRILPTGVSVAAICILCGYLGGNLSVWVRNVVGKLGAIGPNP
jgi:hypothetical protein